MGGDAFTFLLRLYDTIEKINRGLLPKKMT